MNIMNHEDLILYSPETVMLFVDGYITQDSLFHSRQPIRLKTSTRRSTMHTTLSRAHLAVTPEGEGVVPLPGLPPASSGVVVLVATSKTTGLLAGGGKTTRLAVLVDGLDDPVDTGIAADGLVLGVDEDDFVVLVGRVLVDPVRVEHAQVGAAAADTLLGGRLEGALVLELVDTLVGGLACSRVSVLLWAPICWYAYRRWHP
jgi:hypothetical protein